MDEQQQLRREHVQWQLHILFPTNEEVAFYFSVVAAAPTSEANALTK